MFCSINDLLIKKNDCKIFIAKIYWSLNSTRRTVWYVFLHQILILKSYLGFKHHSIGLSEIEHLPYRAREEFAELSSDSNLKLDFSKKPLTEFWIESRSEFPIISDLALNVLLCLSTLRAYVKLLFQL